MSAEMIEKVNKELEWTESMRQFIGRRVEVTYGQRHDWTSTFGTKRGLLLERDGQIILVPRRDSTRGQHLTGGLYDGFYATLTVTKIEAL